MLKVTKFQNFMFNHCRKNTPKVCFEVNVDSTVVAKLSFYYKTTTNPSVFKRKFFELRSEFSHHIEIYTDVSNDGFRTAAAVVAPNSVKTVRLPKMFVFLQPKFMHWTRR